MKFVRTSKYRHVFAAAPRKETVWDGVKLTKNAWDSNFVAVNPNWVGISWQVGGGGAVGLVNLSQPMSSKLDKIPLITGHKGPVLDLEFNPFNDNVLATVSEDCYGKVWVIPQDFQGTLEKEGQLLKGHQRKVGNVAWNPVAENVLATGGTDNIVKIWDVSTGEDKLTFTGHGGMIQSLNWSYDGGLLTSFCKDAKLRVFDPRTNTPVGVVDGHQGVKGGRALFMGKHDKVWSIGFGKTSERQYFIYDVKNLSAPLVGPVTLDNQAGMIVPFYDEDSDLVFLAGKGDGNIRYYEFEDKAEKPEIHFCAQFSSNDPTAAIGSMPKRGVDVNTNEIVKLFRVQGVKLEPLSFKVPRKSDLFQEDIFPDCRSDEPALNAEQWFGGANSKPKTKSLQGGFQKKEGGQVSFQKKDEHGGDHGHKDSGESADLKKENAELKKRVAYLEAELAKLQSHHQSHTTQQNN